MLIAGRMLRERLFVAGDLRLLRYALPTATAFEAAMSLKPNAYFTHGTAAFLNRLSDATPETLHLNHEQREKPTPSGPLTQVAITAAYRRPQRVSKLVFCEGNLRIMVLSGKHTGRLEVASLRDPDGGQVDATGVERTLIDIAVRPAYAGGIRSVLEIYTRARNRMSGDLLLATLKRLDYRYPYHQAIGFLLERAGHERSLFLPLREMGVEFDFYLVHGETRTRYDTTWRLHYPEIL